MVEFFKFLVSFFHGWRRKIGLLTLTLAMVGVGVSTRFHFFPIKITQSVDKGVVAITEWNSTGYQFHKVEKFVVNSNPGNKGSQYSYAEFGSDNFAVDYWPIIFTLTLFSIWLLLYKPRTKQPVNPQLPA